MTKLSPIITDIVHTATQAALTDDEQIQRQGLADIYDAIASVLHVDHRAAKPAEASTDEPPAVSGCPSLGPKVFPSGADGTEPAEDGKNSFYEFFGLKLNRFGGPGLGTRLIGKRVNHPSSQPSVQVFEIDVKRSNGVFGNTATATENGELIFKIEGSVRFNLVEMMAVAALHRILKHRAYTNAKKRRRRARKAATKRAAETKAIVSKELA